MTDVSYDVYLREVLPLVPGVAEPVAINAIRNAVIEFCEQTDWLQFEHPPVTTLASTPDYEFEVEGDYVEARILSAYHGRQLRPTSEEELRQRYGDTDWRTLIGTPVFYLQMGTDTVRLVPMPIEKTSGGLRLLLAIKPSRDSDVADETIYQQWVEGIAMGARSRLHETPGQPYYDPTAAAILRARFNSVMGQARIDRNRGLTRATLRVQMRPFV